MTHIHAHARMYVGTIRNMWKLWNMSSVIAKNQKENWEIQQKITKQCKNNNNSSKANELKKKKKQNKNKNQSLQKVHLYLYSHSWKRIGVEYHYMRSNSNTHHNTAFMLVVCMYYVLITYQTEMCCNFVSEKKFTLNDLPDI